MFSNILFVCMGNICRSPTAEYMLRHYLKNQRLLISSAGLRALVGKPMDINAMSLMLDHGIDTSTHVAQQLSRNMIRSAELILVMEKIHLININNLLPSARGKTFLLGKWHGNQEILDPYHQQRSTFEKVFKLIHSSILKWVTYL